MAWIEETVYLGERLPDIVIPGDDPLNRITDHIDIDWHVQVKPECCKNEETKRWFGQRFMQTHTRPESLLTTALHTGLPESQLEVCFQSILWCTGMWWKREGGELVMQ